MYKVFEDLWVVVERLPGCSVMAAVGANRGKPEAGGVR